MLLKKSSKRKKIWINFTGAAQKSRRRERRRRKKRPSLLNQR